MATVDDILDLVASRVASGIYPNGTGQASTVGVTTRVYPGWPVRSKLDADLRAGLVHISVFPDGHEKAGAAHFREWREIERAENLVDATIVGNVVTFSGTPAPPQTVTAVVGIGAVTASYDYAVQAGDTAAIIATALAALIDGASNVGAVLTLPAAARVRIAIGVWGTLGRELRWNEQRVMVNVWAPTPALRATAAAKVDGILAPLVRANLSDGSSAVFEYHGARTDDELGEAVLFRRTMFYDVGYPTIETESAPEIIVIEAIHAGDQHGGIDEEITTVLGGSP